MIHENGKLHNNSKGTEMIKTGLTPIGMDEPAQVLQAFQDAGNEMLVKLRSVVTSPNSSKTLRTWGIVDAAKMIGTSAPTLRKLEIEGGKLCPPERDENNKRVYTLARINKAREILNTKILRPSNSSPMIATVANFKGGSAKTTTTVHLAQKCALEGLKVLIIDFDPQASSTFIAGSIVPDLELDEEDTINAALIYDSKHIKQVIRKTFFEGLDLIPGNLALQDMELVLPNANINNTDTMGSAATRLKNALLHIKDDYDVILIDCGPNLGVLTINALIASNALLIPIPPNMFDYASFIMLTGTLKKLFSAIKDHRFDFFRLLLTKHSGSNEALHVENMLRTQFGGYILANHMCNTVEIEKATNDLGTVYEIAKPRGGKDAYRRALLHLDAVNNEIINYFRQVWDDQHQKAMMNVNNLHMECATDG